ncbi:MAG: rRNA maturation RNase YbeY [Sulfurovum sp.]
MIDLDNQTQLPIDIDRLEKILQTLSHQEIELIITNNEDIRELNREYRGKDSPTDVLSFPLEQYSDNMPLGSIIISADYVINKASEFDHTVQDELLLLFIHGVLHLLGYDHEVDDGEMRAKEVEIIESFSLPESLIVRA